jgi:hypothetical protein
MMTWQRLLFQPGETGMHAQAHWQPIASILAMTVLIAVPAMAQETNYTPGQKIEYQSSGYPEIWEEATFIGATPNGSQPMIRQKPSEYQRDGFQRAASWATIRPLAAARPAPAPIRPDAPAGTAINARPDTAGGLMTRAEVLAFLAVLGPDPFQHPRREQVKKDLAEMIKARGLDFRASMTDRNFDDKLAKYGATTDIVFPLRDNFGPPTRQAWLMGTWKLGKIGATVDHRVGNMIYRQGEIGVANVGTLTLNANGSYAWKSQTAQSTNGKWRVATAAEMKSQGGDGIVLLGAKSGYDWIVTKNRNTTLAGDWIGISELGTRQINEHGSR